MGSIANSIRNIKLTNYLPAKDYGKKYDPEYQATLDPKTDKNAYIGKQMGQFLAYETLIVLFIIFCIFFELLVRLVRRRIQKRYEWMEPVQVKRMASYAISQLHAVWGIFIWFFMTFLSCPKSFQDDTKGHTFFTNTKCIDYTSPGMEVALVFSIAYFISDLISLKSIFGPGRLTNQTILHHMIAILGFGSALFIGRIAGVIAFCLLITELSTIFLNNRTVMKELALDEDEKWVKLYEINGICLIISFFLSRIIFLGLITFGYVVPKLFTYDYDSTTREIGIFKVRWALLLMILFFGLYILNIFWFYKLIQGVKRYRKAQAEMADKFLPKEQTD